MYRCRIICQIGIRHESLYQGEIVVVVSQSLKINLVQRLNIKVGNIIEPEGDAITIQQNFEEFDPAQYANKVTKRHELRMMTSSLTPIDPRQYKVRTWNRGQTQSDRRTPRQSHRHCSPPNFPEMWENFVVDRRNLRKSSASHCGPELGQRRKIHEFFQDSTQNNKCWRISHYGHVSYRDISR